MKLNKSKSDSFLRRVSLALDDVVEVLSPRRAMLRKSYRFGYDVIDKHRTRKKHDTSGGTGDWHLTQARLDQLREICRDLGRNNPLVKGVFRKLATKIVGTETRIQARTDDPAWNQEAEQCWQEEMVEKPCDVTGRFSFHSFVKLMYHTYCRDGDMFVIFSEDGIQAVEGEQVGTAYGRRELKELNIVNGIEFDKVTQKVTAYYVGTPNKWGYIENKTFKRYRGDLVLHIFKADRFSCTRGEPALISAVDMVEKLFGYIDAELIAAKINACFPMMVTTRDDAGKPAPFTKGISATGLDEYNRELQKIDPGIIWYGGPGEKAEAIGSARPASAFDNFVTRILMLIGQPVSLPLMLMTGDYSGATFMNSRVAYQEAQEIWRDEQNLIIKPFVRRLWLTKIKEWIAAKKLNEHKDWARHEIICKRWPYVDPWKEAKADEQQLKNGTITRTIIAARQGEDFKDITAEREKEEKLLKEKGIVLVPEKKAQPAA